MLYVHVIDLVSGAVIAVPKKIAPYVALWTGANWISSYRAHELLTLNEAFRII